ncbi:MAG: hypothetical protein HYU80_00610 [Candidatus Blackburnbacteria bacterium]|nr:hypothetical protein [Candidatus Blackburnbacteria bacterium]
MKKLIGLLIIIVVAFLVLPQRVNAQDICTLTPERIKSSDRSVEFKMGFPNMGATGKKFRIRIITNRTLSCGNKQESPNQAPNPDNTISHTFRWGVCSDRIFDEVPSRHEIQLIQEGKDAPLCKRTYAVTPGCKLNISGDNPAGTAAFDTNTNLTVRGISVPTPPTGSVYRLSISGPGDNKYFSPSLSSDGSFTLLIDQISTAGRGYKAELQQLKQGPVAILTPWVGTRCNSLKFDVGTPGNPIDNQETDAGYTSTPLLGFEPTFCDPSREAIQTAVGCIPIRDTNQFVGWFLRWALGIAGGVAFILILIAGFQITTASGNPEKVQGGKELLNAAISGLILIIFSVFLLKLIGVDILALPGFNK